MTLEELALSNMWETSALVELLGRKGILTRIDVLAMIQELRRKHPQATKYNHPPQSKVLSPSGSSGDRLCSLAWCVDRSASVYSGMSSRTIR